MKKNEFYLVKELQQKYGLTSTDDIVINCRKDGKKYEVQDEDDFEISDIERIVITTYIAPAKSAEMINFTIRIEDGN